MMENNDFEKMNIQWFPGHMTKAQRMIEDNIKLVDAVCEVIDAHPARQPQPGYRPPCRGQAPPLLSSTAPTFADPELYEALEGEL